MHDLLPRCVRSFLGRLYVLHRLRLFVGSRVFPPSPSIQPQNLRRQLVALVERTRRADAAMSANTPHSHPHNSRHISDTAQKCQPQPGFRLDVRTSSIPNAGNGVFLRSSSVPAGTLLTLYPGNVRASPRLVHTPARFAFASFSQFRGYAISRSHFQAPSTCHGSPFCFKAWQTNTFCASQTV